MKLASVYEIKINDKVRYIGITNNFVRRQKEHLRSIKKGEGKFLYQKINEIAPDQLKISFRKITDDIPILEAKRLEAYLILIDWFGKRELYQSAPYSFKYF